MKTNSNLGHLRFAPDILRRLGEELIPNFEQGIIEIVKNSYDADSKNCSIKFEGVRRKGGAITIIDDGKGMTEDDILNGFLMVGRSRKSPRQKTKSKRLTVGDKGLGRIAALRLGQMVEITSRPKSEPGKEYYALIDWSDIDAAIAIEDVAIPIESRNTTLESGTELVISNLRRGLKTEEIERLSREIILLKDPFSENDDFKVTLSTKEFKKYEDMVRSSYFPYANYKLEAEIASDGRGHAFVYDKTGEIAFETKLPLHNNKKYSIPPTRFEMWVWILSPDHFNESTIRLSHIREWLKTVGGVHIYHREVRIPPYGDAGYDWLDMNLARARRPEERPSTNNVLGRIIVQDPKLMLTQPTNRIGFVETVTFDELKRFAKDALDWMGRERLRMAEARRERDKISGPGQTQYALSELKQVIRASKSPASEKKEIELALEHYVKTKESEVVILQDELQLYRSLATAGTTSAVFAHESSKPITVISSATKTLERRAKKIISEKYDEQLRPPIERIREVSESLKSYSRFPLFHLKRSKRQLTDVDINIAWNEIIQLFRPLLEEAKIDFSIQESEAPAIVRGSMAMIESIATNLLTNSIHALTKRSTNTGNRLIQVKIEHQGDTLRIIHSDNAEGIKNIDIEKIWLPGETTNTQGTGFGLTIVRDSVNDLHGSVAVIPNGELGGAEFYITLPAKKVVLP